MEVKPLIPVFHSPRDLALKLFREAGRTWNAQGLQHMGDHLFNFCVTNTSLRDWLMQVKGVKGDTAFYDLWRGKADGLFGECTDIANASKHLVVKKTAVTMSTEELVALGPDGAIPGSERTRDTFTIVLSNGNGIDLLIFIHKICTEWEDIFRSDPDLSSLPPHGEFLVTRL
jgi:hypothetical protein